MSLDPKILGMQSSSVYICPNTRVRLVILSLTRTTTTPAAETPIRPVPTAEDLQVRWNILSTQYDELYKFLQKEAHDADEAAKDGPGPRPSRGLTSGQEGTVDDALKEFAKLRHSPKPVPSSSLKPPELAALSQKVKDLGVLVDRIRHLRNESAVASDEEI